MFVSAVFLVVCHIFVLGGAIFVSVCFARKFELVDVGGQLCSCCSVTSSCTCYVTAVMKLSGKFGRVQSCNVVSYVPVGETGFGSVGLDELHGHGIGAADSGDVSGRK